MQLSNAANAVTSYLELTYLNNSLQVSNVCSLCVYQLLHDVPAEWRDTHISVRDMPVGVLKSYACFIWAQKINF